MSSAAASRTGQLVLSTHDLKVGYIEGDEATQLLTVPDLKLSRGSRTAAVSYTHLTLPTNREV